MQSLDLCVKLAIVCVQFSLVIFPLHLDVAEFIVSNQPSKTFHELTDLNLGVLMAMSDTAPDGISCVNKLRSAAHIHLAQVSGHYTSKTIHLIVKRIIIKNIFFAMKNETCLVKIM